MAIVIAVAAGVVGLTAPGSEAASGGGVVGGAIVGDTVWDAGSYTAAAPVQVPAGVTLTLRAGAQLSTSAQTAFTVAGTLRIEGSAAAPVRISSTDWRGSLLVGVADLGARVFIDRLQADFFESVVGDDEPAAFSMTNSRMWSRPDRNSTALSAPLPAGSTLTGNEFVNVEGLRMDLAGPSASVVEGNRFSGSTFGLFGKSPVSFTGNAFAPGPEPALRAWSGTAPLADLDAEGNYWGADTADAIEARIDDARDGAFNELRVDYAPFLTAAPPATTFSPLPPLDVTGVGGAKAANVMWTAPVSDGGAAVTSYTVTAQPGGQQVTVPGDARLATFTGLTDGVPYTFTVTASNGRGASLSSTPSAAVRPMSPPAIPTGIKAVSSVRGANVSWTPVPGALRYLVTAWPGGHVTTVWPIPTRNQPMQTTVRGLPAGKSYRYTVEAWNIAGSLGPSAASAPTPAADRPGAVAKPRVVVTTTRDGRAKVRVSWTAPPANGARIRYYRVVGSRGLGTTKVRAPKRSLVIENLKAGRYTFRVSAWNWVGDSRGTYPVTVKVPTKR